MLRIQINMFLAAIMALGMAACVPRQTPAPVVSGANGSNAYVYPRDASGGIIVRPGDTLYAISRYQQTELQALIEANNLEPPFIIKPGQVIHLPGQPGTAPAAGPQTQITGQPLAAVEKPAASDGRTPGPGKTPRPRPATAEKPKPAALVASVSPARPPEKPNAGTMARTSPAQRTVARARTLEESAVDDAIPPQPRKAPARKLAAGAKPPPQPVKVAHATTVPATRPANRPINRNVRFLWPANGPILSDFGPKSNGLHNDGINIAMPPNGPVVAAADGIVSYVGNGLRGYGNLLLIRHEGGWVTAYAHNSELLVDKGARVQRGQVIARAGRSGGVPQDQLHFEVREGARAVDPKPLLVGG